jgi:hypothetical protein
MFEAYIDDGGTDSGTPIAIAAGYISTKRAWGQFVAEWNEVRREEDFDVFHMADFAASPAFGKKPFCDWSTEKRRRVYNRLAGIINQNKRIGFGIVVPKDVFENLVPPLPYRLKQTFGIRPFPFAVRAVLGLIGEWRMQSMISLPTQYVFDRMGKGKGEIGAFWDDIEDQQWKDNIFGMEQAGYSFQNKDNLPPLQAADILSWQMNWHMQNIIYKAKRDIEDAHPHFSILRRNQEMKLGFLTEENFRNTIEMKRQHLEFIESNSPQVNKPANGWPK